MTEQAIELLKIYVQEPPPKDILWIEQEFIVPVHNSAGEYLETPLLTVLDLVSMDDGRMKISEFKTQDEPYGEFEVDTSLQATCYVNALWETLQVAQHGIYRVGENENTEDTTGENSPNRRRFWEVGGYHRKRSTDVCSRASSIR